MKLHPFRRGYVCVGLAACWLAAGRASAAELRLTQTEWTSQGLAVHWTDAGPGLDYVVQTRPSLQSGLWLTPFWNHPMPLSGTSWTDPSALEAMEPMRFYRLMAVPSAQRGRVLNSWLRRSMSALEINILLALAGVPLTVPSGVDVYSVSYETVDFRGARTVATGALVEPQTPGGPVPLLSYQHGTIVETNGAPSAQDVGELLVGLVFAASGYVVAMPDYLGLGGGSGLHPYQHARSEATACVDMLRAARALALDHGRTLNGQLFITGYSQGGHATLALHRELETFHTNEFTLTASAPMAGAYDMSGVMTDDMLSGRPVPNPYYYAYLLAAYQEVYHLTNSLADLLASPYNVTLPPMFDGRHSGSEINALMPSDVRQIFKPEVLAAFEADPQHPLRLALRDNDLLDWTPRAPLRLYHCSGDQDVPYANSLVARDAFHSRGATQVEVINALPGGTHGTCVLPALLQAKQWFDSLKQ